MVSVRESADELQQAVFNNRKLDETDSPWSDGSMPASMLKRGMTCQWLSLSLVILGCGSQQSGTKPKMSTSLSCSSSTSLRVDIRQGQEHRWCEDGDGLIDGPVTVFYSGGRKKLKFHMNRGEPAGDYMAWHESGRWAVKANYTDGQLTGPSDYRPPHGPPSTCEGQACSGMQAVLDRPFCLLEEIERVFNESNAILNDCLGSSSQSAPVEFTARWTITLAGRTERVEVSTLDQTNALVIECLNEKIGSFAFPAPIGQPCNVSLNFALGFKAITGPSRPASHEKSITPASY
ncbi:MAG: hypothetical protein VYA30_16455 [Myxococcota bacterium]|nr:hypothetical protein [Myxococcota bacterium]